ncbi:MAG: NfeD family protein [Syntrophotaleaceae bacterium]
MSGVRCQPEAWNLEPGTWNLELEACLYGKELEVTFIILWWHWLALGLLLVLAELVVPSFTIFWFGLAAALTGLLLLPFPGMPLAAQLGFFALFSTLCTLLWFRLLRPRMVNESAFGKSRDEIVGEPGIVIRDAAIAGDKGRCRFAVPLLGREEWPCVCSGPLRLGDQVRVTGVEGQVLRVEKL